MNFQKYGDMPIAVQSFKRKEIFVERCGQKINCYDSIQAANVDTNIYDVMKKYHCQMDQAIEFMKAKGGEQGVYADIVSLQQKMQDLGDVKNVIDTAQQLFDRLPTEIKQKYGQDLSVFLKEQEILRKKQAEKQNEDSAISEKQKNYPSTEQTKSEGNK